MKNIKLRVLYIVAMLVFVVSIPKVIDLLLAVPTPFLYGDRPTWLSFFGNYVGTLLGGMIGGHVAFWTAKIQIANQKELERERTAVVPKYITVI